MQLRPVGGLTEAEYVSSQAWERGSLGACPLHGKKCLSFARHSVPIGLHLGSCTLRRRAALIAAPNRTNASAPRNAILRNQPPSGIQLPNSLFIRGQRLLEMLRSSFV